MKGRGGLPVPLGIIVAFEMSSTTYSPGRSASMPNFAPCPFLLEINANWKVNISKLAMKFEPEMLIAHCSFCIDPLVVALKEANPAFGGTPLPKGRVCAIIYDALYG